MTRVKWLVLLVIGLTVSAVLLAACGSETDRQSSSDTNMKTTTETKVAPTPGPVASEYRTLSIDQFADIVEHRADEYEIINVHIPYAGEVANTDANIPYNDLEALMAAIPDKNAPVILYCRSGNMSKQAARALLDQGYTHIWDVPGGISAWQASGRALIDK